MKPVRTFWSKVTKTLKDEELHKRVRRLFEPRPKTAPLSVPPPLHKGIEAPVIVRQYEEHPSEAYMELKFRFRDIGRLDAIAETIGRDFLTAMPEGAWRSRLGQISYLHRLVHEKLTAPDMLKLFERARNHVEQNPSDWDEWDAANLREMIAEHDCSGALPADLIEKKARLEYEGRRRHRDALAQSDWPAAREFLSGQVDMGLRIAELRTKATGGNSLYQSMMEEYLPGVSEIDLDDWFGVLHKKIHAMLPKILERQGREEPPRDIADFYPAKAQMWLNKALLQAIGFDFERGGIYETGHNPVEGGTPDDTRLVIKNVDIRNFMISMKSALHEGGHGIYTQNLPRRTWRYQPVGQDMGSAVHESQALLIEMVIGRTRAFYDFAAPRIEGLFHGLNNPMLTAENLYKLKTRVKPSPDRKTADEATYFFHIEHRTRLEKQLIEGTLKVADLPEAWNAAMQDILGIQPQTMAEGCLQDVHWFVGKFGYFPAYTVGHMLAAQQFEAMEREIPDIQGCIASGRLAPLTGWLSDKIHSKGCLLDFQTLIRSATGSAPDPSALVRHLERRYVKAV
jgi:carboxypeptidase Taq